MSEQDEKETTTTANGAIESAITALKSRVQNDSSDLPQAENQLKKCPPSLSDGLAQLKEHSRREGSGIKARFKENQKIKFGMTDELARRFAERYLNAYKNLDFDQTCNIGHIILRNYGDMKAIGFELGIPHYTVRELIVSNADLLYFYNIALQGIKELTERNIIEFLQAKDKDITKLMTRLFYKGRKMGGYNPSEFGTWGFGDPVGDHNAEVTKGDEETGDKFTVNFIFEEKPIPPQFTDGELVEEANALDVDDIMSMDVDIEEDEE